MSDSKQKYGVILANLGSPTAPTSKGVKDFLLPFLSDPRVVDSPRWFWIPLLRGVIIPLRAPRVAKAYASVWTEHGSPLTVISNQQATALQHKLNSESEHDIHVELAMTYNEPSIKGAIAKLQHQGIEKIVVLPLYPQHSSSTTAAVFDAVNKAVIANKNVPDFRYVRQYSHETSYIQALADSIKEYSATNSCEDDYLVFSFHGIPKRFVSEGDPYQAHCEQTARDVALALGLTDEQWQLAYQSRVGREEWLKPYFDETLAALPDKGIKRIRVISPAFAADCLETLEEIDIENREVFLESGGESYHYVPALNEREDHIALMAELVEKQLANWQ